MPRKQVGDIESDVLLIGALAIGGVFAVKAVLASFGSDPANQQLFNTQTTKSPSQNPFNPAFQPFVDNFNANSNGVSISDAMTAIQQQGDAGTLDPSGNGYVIYTWANTLASALSVWNFTVDTNAVFSVFSQMTNQTQCASLAAYCSYVLNKDLLTWLHYGGSAIPFIPNGLSYDQISTIVNEINLLPS